MFFLGYLGLEVGLGFGGGAGVVGSPGRCLDAFDSFFSGGGWGFGLEVSSGGILHFQFN
jgi:hypothetical protein